jgi:CDGSH-type Zn-finger protein
MPGSLGSRPDSAVEGVCDYPTGYGRTVSARDVLIVPYRDGPYLVRGPVTLRDQSGNEIPLSRNPIALCRCGKSRIRPFCDGTHQRVRFRAPSAAEALDAPEHDLGAAQALVNQALDKLATVPATGDVVAAVAGLRRAASILEGAG